MLAWLKRQAELSRRAAAEAEALIARLGDEGAYQEARSRVGGTRDYQSPDLYWVRVRREIARRTGRDHVDTATRYLEPDGSIKVWPSRENEDPMKSISGHGLDIRAVEAAFKRAAHRAVHGTREERSGRFILSGPVSTRYDPASGNLEIHFGSGRTYLYSNVSLDVYEAFLNAESKGAFFNAQIRDRYPYREQAQPG
jgi:KTSC domain